MTANSNSITRRTAIAGAAAMIPATAIPALALASGTDPVFAAIANYASAFDYSERLHDQMEALECILHNRASAIADAEAPECIPARERYHAIMHEPPSFDLPKDDPAWIAFRAEQSAYCDSRHNHIRCRALGHELKKTPEGVEIERMRELAIDAWSGALWAVADTVPTSTVGAAALIAFYSEQRKTNDLGAQDRDLADGETIQTYPEAVMASLAAFMRVAR